MEEHEVDAVKHEIKNDDSVKVAAEIPGLFSVSLELHRIALEKDTEVKVENGKGASNGHDQV